MKNTKVVPYEPLTTREMEILALIVNGSSNREIANRLFIAHSTVRWYIRQIYGKLGAETREEAIELALTTGIAPPALETGWVIRHNLPVQTNSFIGRECELDELSQMVADSDCRLITIVAPGGMGKTRLALALAERVMALPEQIEQMPNRAGSFQDGVFFIALASLTTPDLLISTIADSIGYRFQSDGRDLKQQLLDFLHEKQMWLILDNAEHLRGGMGIASEILAYAKDIQIVVTSRERLNLNVETVYTIAGLPFGDWETLEGALAGDCVKLFLQSAKRVKPSFTLAVDEIDSLARVCQLVDGMPLAIELAAAWVAMLSLEEIANEITQNLDFLSSNMQDTPQRQHSIRAVFEYTWKRLSTAEQNVLMKLSVFRGGWAREAAEEVAGADLLLLRALVSKSLIDHGADGRFEMQGLLHQFAEEQLELAEEAPTTCAKHSAYYADYLYQLNSNCGAKSKWRCWASSNRTLKISGPDGIRQSNIR